MTDDALPAEVQRLAKDKTYATVVTLFPDGTPQAQLTWVDTDGTHLLVNTSQGRQRTRNVRRDPRVSVLLVDPQNPFQTAEIRGHVAEIVEGDEPRAHIDELSERYTGGPYANPIESPRVILKIVPDKIV